MNSGWAGRSRSLFFGRDALPGAVGSQLPGLRVVGQERLEDRLELVAHVRRPRPGTTTSIRWSRLRGIRSALPSRYVFSSPASKQKSRLCSRKRPSTERTRMFSLSPSTPGTSVQIARTIRSICGARLRGPVQLLDEVGVGQVVDLDPDAGGLSLLGRGCDRADVLDQPPPQVERRGEDLAELLRPAEAGDEVEEVGDVGGDVGVGGEEPDVLVDPRGRRVVVAGADVDVAPQLVALARGRRASSSRGSSCPGTRRRRARPPARASAPIRCCAARRSALSARRRRRSACRSPPPASARGRARSRGSCGRRSSSASTTCGSFAAARTNDSTLVANESYGCWTTMSRCAISANRSPSVGRCESPLCVRQPRLVLEVGPIERVELPDVGEVEQPRDRVDARRGGRRAAPRAARASPARSSSRPRAARRRRTGACAARSRRPRAGRRRRPRSRCPRHASGGRRPARPPPSPGRATAGSARSPPRAGSAARGRRPRGSAGGPPAPSPARTAPRPTPGRGRRRRG